MDIRPFDSGSPDASETFPGFARIRGGLATLFLFVAIPTCLFLAVVTPPGQVPDEPAHVIRAASMFNGPLLARHTTGPVPAPYTGTLESVGFRIDSALFECALFFLTPPDQTARKVTTDNLAVFLEKDWSKERRLYSVPNTAQYFPVLYVVTSATLSATKQLGGGPGIAIIAGRLMNALAYAALGYAALRCCVGGRGLLFAVLCFPESLSLAASFNQDGLLIALMALATAFASRAAASGPTVASWRWYRGCCALLALVVLAKPIYAPVLVLLLLPIGRDHTLRSRLAVTVLCLLPGLVWAWVAVRHVSVPFWIPDYHPGPLYPGDPAVTLNMSDPGAQARILIARPMLLLSLPFDTINDSAGLLFNSAIGVLGSLDLRLPDWLYTLWYVACGALLLADGGVARVPWRGRALVLVALVGQIWAIFIVQYLTWTPVGNDRIAGVQGRYLLPLLPLLIFVAPAMRWATIRICARAAAAVPALAGIGVAPLAVVARYLVR